MAGLSIVVTYYKGENFIFTCIDSILDSYSKSTKALNLEIILVIDSMDDAERIEVLLIEKYNPQYLKIIKNNKNIGVSASRNVALKNVKFEFYTVIDQDDYLKENYFSILETKLDTNIAVHIINATILQVDKNIEVPIYYFTPSFNFKDLILKNTFIYTPGLLIFNSKFIKRDNIFIDTSDKYKGCDDWAAYLNLLIDSNNKVTQKFIKEPLFVYCLHSSNYSNNKGEMINSSVAVLDYLKKKSSLNEDNLADVELANKMQQFYYVKDVQRSSKTNLLRHFPSEFLFHYLTSFLNRQRMNRLIFRLKFFKKSLVN